MKFINNLFKSDFTRNVVTLMTGTTIAQAIPLAISPILTRIYTPEDFGLLGLFLAISSIAGAIATGRYEQAILLPEKNENALEIVQLCGIISGSFSLLFLIIVLLFNYQISIILGNQDIRDWLYLIPISTFVLGMYNTLNYYNIRAKKFRNISKSQIYRSSSLGAAQILIGLVKAGALGLILGQILSYFTGISVLSKNIPKIKNPLFKSNLVNLKKQAIQYVKFPKYSLPSIFVNSTILNVTPLLISSIFSVATLGFYSLSMRIISVPSRIFGSSFSQAFYQRSTELLNNGQKLEPTFVKTLKRLLLVGIPCFVILYLIVEPVFTIVFGLDWKVSGTYAKVLLPLAGMRFLSSSLSPTTNIVQKQYVSLLINITLLLITVFLFFYSTKSDLKFIDLLYYLTFFLSIIYLAGIFVYWYLIRQSDKSNSFG